MEARAGVGQGGRVLNILDWIWKQAIGEDRAPEGEAILDCRVEDGVG